MAFWLDSMFNFRAFFSRRFPMSVRAHKHCDVDLYVDWLLAWVSINTQSLLKLMLSFCLYCSQVLRSGKTSWAKLPNYMLHSGEIYNGGIIYIMQTQTDRLSLSHTCRRTDSLTNAHTYTHIHKHRGDILKSLFQY